MFFRTSTRTVFLIIISSCQVGRHLLLPGRSSSPLGRSVVISSCQVGRRGLPLISALCHSCGILTFCCSHPRLDVVCPCDSWSSLSLSPSTIPSNVSRCIPSCLMMCPKTLFYFCIFLKFLFLFWPDLVLLRS